MFDFLDGLLPDLVIGPLVFKSHIALVQLEIMADGSLEQIFVHLVQVLGFDMLVEEHRFPIALLSQDVTLGNVVLVDS